MTVVPPYAKLQHVHVHVYTCIILPVSRHLQLLSPGVWVGGVAHREVDGVCGLPQRSDHVELLLLELLKDTGHRLKEGGGGEGGRREEG